MSLGKHLSGYTVDDEGHSLMDLVNLCNLSCKCGMSVELCVLCAPFKMKILNLIEKILRNHGIRKIHTGEKCAPDTCETMVYYYDDSRQYISILINEQGHIMGYTFHGTLIYSSEYKCMYGNQLSSYASYLISALTCDGLKELGDYAQLLMSSSI